MERKMRREEALGAEYLESHTCVPHTPTHAHICWNRDELLVQSCRLRAFFFFFFPWLNEVCVRMRISGTSFLQRNELEDVLTTNLPHHIPANQPQH